MESLTDAERSHLEPYGVTSDYLLVGMVREQRVMQESDHGPPPCWECFQMALKLKIW